MMLEFLGRESSKYKVCSRNSKVREVHRGGSTNYLKLIVNDKKDCIANV